MTLVEPRAAVRRRVEVRGVVQGVGFRPFVHALARRLDLAGFVGNDGAGVFVEVEGDAAAVEAFVRLVRDEAPPLAVVDSVASAPVEPRGEAGFGIVASEGRATPGAPALVPPDVAMCADCRRELFDPADRRYRHPFITCTNCGPRFTIVTGLPYDRPRTTMAGFPLCDACAAEYHDPTDRRFHAQPIACPDCGPRLRLPGHEGDPVAGAQAVLRAGLVVAVKGVGGFHLACDARDDGAVTRLRARKGRAAKPFAVMARDLDTVRTFAEVDDAEAALLAGPQHPIVLLRARGDHPLAGRVAPGNGRVGVMLPYSPLHALLLDGPGAPDVLVMTSGNRADEPIAVDDDEALERLAGLADAFLLHDRPIARPCDDSVVRVVAGRELPVRRSRGWAPHPVTLPYEVVPTLAVGGEIKTTFALAAGRHVWLSQHLGDMGNLETLRAFERSLASLRSLYGVDPVVVAADAHPGYLTGHWAERRAAATGAALVRVQHHHAHAAALHAEHGLAPDEALLAVTFDGTGYGDDGAIWGGEVLRATARSAERVAHLAASLLPGGDAAVRHPGRVALAGLRAAGLPWSADLPVVRATPERDRGLLATQLARGVACVPTTSMGRLFDAVAALLGVCTEAGYEAQAAIELEARCRPGERGAYPFALVGTGPVRIDPAPLWRALVHDLRAGVDVGVMATRFHRGVAALVVRLAGRLADGAPVGLTGGVFQNAFLLEATAEALEAAGHRVLTHRLVPPNDGGLALGQAVVAGLRSTHIHTLGVPSCV